MKNEDGTNLKNKGTGFKSGENSNQAEQVKLHESGLPQEQQRKKD